MNKVFSLPRYTEIVVQDDFRQKIYHAVRKGDINVVTILAPLTENPNAPNDIGKTPSSFTKNAEIFLNPQYIQWN